MSTIKPIPQEDLQEFVEIVTNAYPAMELDSSDARYRVLDRLEQSYIDDTRQLIGLYRDVSLLGGMFLYDFKMNIHDTFIDTGGIGLVAVHLLHKKEKVAKELIQFSLDYFHKKKAPLVSLFPFRPDFYKRMGFGYGPKISHYLVLPSAIPRGGSRENIHYMEESDGPKLLKCYDRYTRRTHGMILRRLEDIERQLFRPDGRVVAFLKDGHVKGYLVFSFEKGETFLQNDLYVNEMIYDEPEVLNHLLTFLHTQLDQVRRIIFDIHDSEFHHLLADPRNDSGNLIPFVYHETNTQGMGLMYRVIDMPLLFALLRSNNFGDQTVTLGIEISDSFYPANQRSVVIKFAGGSGEVAPETVPEATITLDIADFSSLIMGTVSFRNQYLYGLAEISDPKYVPVVDDLFRADRQPICMTQF
jgi:predicted acetyltransferase